MTLNEIKDAVQSSDYDFLRTNPHLGSNIILLGLGGSHAYGTNIETSDLDIRGVALNSKSEILLNRDFESIVNVDTDTTVYSFNKIIELLTNCNPNTIELLGLEPEDYLHITPIGQMLLDNTNLFLSKACVRSFGGYANQQLYRLQQKSLCAVSDLDYEKHIARTLNGMAERLEDKFNVKIDVSLSDNDEIVLNGNLNDLKAEDMAAILSELNNTLRDYRKRSQRNDKAMAHGKIAKHSMHLIRLYMMCLDLMEKHIIKTKRTEERELLMDIRNGKYLDENGTPNSAFFDIFHEYEKKFDYAKEHTTLPDKPDFDKINEFKMQVNEMVVRQ